MGKILKPKSLLPLPIAIVSFEVYLGMVLGYFLAKYYDQNIYGKKVGKFFTCRSIFIPLAGYKIHLHHWLYAFLILIGGIIFHPFFTFSPLPIGFLCGIMFHDIIWDKDWYRIVEKKK